MAQRAPVTPMRTSRIPPHNLDAEMSVLGAMLESRDAIANVVEIVQTADFYKPAHAEIFQTILALWHQGEPADAVTVADELARRGTLDTVGGKPYILGLIDAYPTASSAAHYARLVEEHALLRRLVDAGNQVQEIGFSQPEEVDDAVDQAEEIVYKVGDRRLREDIRPIRPLLAENMEMIEQLYNRGEHVTGLSTGFADLDEKTAGFQPSNLIIMAARPSMGKSAILGDFALHASIHQGVPVVIFALEMSRHEMVQRFLASQAKVDSQRLRRGSLQEQDWTRLSAALGRLAEAPIYIDDSASITLMEMRAKCRRLKAKHGLGLIIIDYLQLMQSPRRSENRQQEVSEISRALKIMARDLEVPVICASQLNRGVEYRSDKRPLLADLRESGCVTGDSLVALASGQTRPIRGLVGSQPEVVCLDGWKVTTRRATKVWCTGRKQVFRLTTATGRVVRATSNHPFRVLGGWEALNELRVGDRIAIPRTYPPSSGAAWDTAKVMLLAHLIGDGCYASKQPLHYTTASDAHAQVVEESALSAFGVAGKRIRQDSWWHVYLSSNGNRWHPNPIRKWLGDLGVDGHRSKDKVIPQEVFGLPVGQVALFMRHLWSTDGCVFLGKRGTRRQARIYYGTSSPELAFQIQHLLARFGIRSRVKSVPKGDYSPSYQVHVNGASDQLRFADKIGAFGDREPQLTAVVEFLREIRPNTNVATIPLVVWEQVKARLSERGITQRQMAVLRGTTYGGTSHLKFSPSRQTLATYASLLEDEQLQDLAESDVHWDTIRSIEPDGVEDVYDMTVAGTHNFVANGVVVHNSIEQDSDLVMFLYRDEVYNPDTEHKGEAELILAKHRNGPTGLVRLAFMNQYTKFASFAKGQGF
ncbi:MAG: replicative DNA helicase [Actinomycetota bacterium]|nr:replicative DNA helicase [Actinomycetota bacterium]